LTGAGLGLREVLDGTDWAAGSHKYDKFMHDIDYVREQYLIAEPWLNIISNPNPDIATLENERINAMQLRIEALEQTLKRFEKMTDTKVTLRA